MKLISWNVNGLRACLTHGFADSFAALDADIFSVQETKMQPGQADFAPEGYTEYTYSAEKKGYSGTACWCRQVPLAVTTGIGLEEHDHEGRVLTLEYPGFYLVNCYTPNSQDGLKRLDYRMTWEDAFRAYLLGLDAKKPVILCGDLNVAHTEMDIKNAKTNRMSAGFTDQERAKMTELLAAGFADSFRVVHPDEVKYSWWSYRFHAREKNAGWRIDYFIVSQRIADKIRAAEIHNEVFGSDHCPVELDIDLQKRSYAQELSAGVFHLHGAHRGAAWGHSHWAGSGASGTAHLLFVRAGQHASGALHLPVCPEVFDLGLP